MGPGSRVVRNDQLPSAKVDEDIVFLNDTMDSYVAVDEIGRQIWELLASPRRVDELVAELSKQYSGAKSTIETDVVTFLEQLEREGIVRVVDDDVY